MKLSQIEKTKLRTWVELDRIAIKKNYRTFRNMVKNNCILMAVVKSNAYGHELIPFSKEVVRQGVKFLGVDSFDEAMELRKVGIKVRIMVFGYVSPAFYKQASEKNISLTISNFPALKFLLQTKLKKNIKIHIKVDTGLGRQGFLMEDMTKVFNLLKTKVGKDIEIEGLYSHLAVGESLKRREYTMLQAKRLLKWETEFKKLGYKPLKHICATSSTMFFPELHYDMVRVGIGMYGLWPSLETKLAMQKKYKLFPVLSWKTIITEIKHLPKGAKIGYDLTEKLKRNSFLGIIPVGYWHGYPRLLSSKGIFNVKGKKVKLIGRVSMDMITLDLTNVRAKVGDEVAIIGGDYGHYAEADIMAQDSDTINYEITTRINPIIKRFYRINPLLPRIIV
ncbi:alanine racemase [Candidatus Nomurabacteria bacterium RIFCSPHIGHO2_02_FULL_37_13]|uniref:Alanine racemase n=1 Tax=Candidatus Nomurabacteria bacterium RIFCSPHIGHO2_02_FULL_37_13 TaxID=1801750 RepID=A0A1F6W782_9BACT|nr:MAG: alanine racemase [Candidatus Nomurabacteria bacterium RIFCSPHIGHO2_01_FULL_36_23]OGI77626.1 MAG: alanine racemase [Candidatus Nomurabacteria bacterium RIFCSPHIGHO2_02_FULL_37_13]OGI88284.1 MAG: alanine racemase [Candidatus Nomurabacteria bacterium RIFCSPLOWO2_01_FULL_37_25]